MKKFYKKSDLELMVIELAKKDKASGIESSQDFNIEEFYISTGFTFNRSAFDPSEGDISDQDIIDLYADEFR